MRVYIKARAPKISSCEPRARATGKFSEVLCMLEGLTHAFSISFLKRVIFLKICTRHLTEDMHCMHGD